MTGLSFENLIGGKWRGPAAAEPIPVRDPADLRTTVATVPALSAADVSEIYEWAARGLHEWRRSSPLERGGVLSAAATLLRQRVDTVAVDIVREMGKTLAEARVEVAKSADFLDYYASFGRLPIGYLLGGGEGVQATVRTEPVGVVVAITPWNDPLLTPARKIAPALFAGNAVILKPATNTPLASLHLARALHDAGLPAGTLGTVTGRVADISQALFSDPRLAAVSFTGSNSVGAAIRRTLADQNVRLQTEMGGKNAAVVLCDADLDHAAATIEAAAFGQAGQRCTATSRVVAQRSVRAELLDRIVERARQRRLGHGLEPDTTMGPLASRDQQDSVVRYIEAARAAGAAVATGGSVPASEALQHGCFVEPTVLVDVDRSMEAWREEIFGPVIAFVEVDSIKDAITAVNDSAFGLSAAVFTRSLEDASRFADEVDTGQVAVNLATSGWDVHMPFGGFGNSGSAFKEQGLEGLRFYTRTKTIAVRAAA